MKNTKLLLQDNRDIWKQLLPFTYTRPISSLRMGIDTIREKWEAILNIPAEIETETYLLKKFQNQQASKQYTLIINSSVIPTDELVQHITNLTANQSLEKDGIFLAQKIENDQLPKESVEYNGKLIQITRPWHIFLKNKEVFELDFQRITSGREGQQIPSTNQVVNANDIFLEEGAEVEFSVLDASQGPIYIGNNAKILAGCMVKGGLALCDHAVLKMGTKHYGTSTLGPHCKAGGELSNVVMQAYSNKGHDGYLGNAVIGEWCNIGADSNASNLKNNYSNVRAWSYAENKQINTDEQFIGLLMGDHAKCGINTMFNTATVVGVAANIFGAGFPKKHIPSFAWGGVDFVRTFTLQKAYEMAEVMMKRRGIEFTAEDKAIFNHIFEESKQYRNN